MRSYRNPVFLAVSVAMSSAAVAALTACGSSKSGSGSGAGRAAPSACSLLTTADITAATHVTFNDGKLERSEQTPFGKYTRCIWQDEAHPLNAVTVAVWDEASAYDASRQTSGKAKESAGVGSKSFSASFAGVFAIVDDHTLFVQYYSPEGSDEAHLPISTSLAKTASARL